MEVVLEAWTAELQCLTKCDDDELARVLPWTFNDTKTIELKEDQ